MATANAQFLFKRHAQWQGDSTTPLGSFLLDGSHSAKTERGQRDKKETTACPFVVVFNLAL